MTKRMSELRYSEFKDRLDVAAFEEAIGFEPLETRKGNDIGYCPDPWGLHKHGDTTGKFAIHRDKLAYNCWVCGGGSLLSLAMMVMDMDVDQATDWLYQFTTPKAESGEDFLTEVDGILSSDSGDDHKALPWFNERVLTQWSEEYHPWYLKQGIEPAVAQEYNLRYAEAGVRYAPIHKRTKKPLGDNYVGPTIVIPHLWEGRLVGWQNRWLDDDRPDWVPKYTNTKDFPKETTIFNYHRVAFGSYFPPKMPVVVTESVPTALRLAGLDIPAVATFGSAVTQNQMKLLKWFHQGVVLAPDNDKAGFRFLFSLSDYLERSIPVSVHDPTDLPESNNLGDYEDTEDLLDALSEVIPVT